MFLWELCGNLWEGEEKCGKGCGNVGIVLYICVNKKRVIILIMRELIFLGELGEMNWGKMGWLIFSWKFLGKKKNF